MDVQILFLPIELLFHIQQYPHDLAPISVELCYVWPVTGCVGRLVPILSRTVVRMGSLWMMVNSQEVLKIAVDGTVCGLGCQGLELWWWILYEWLFNLSNFCYNTSSLSLTYLVAQSHGLLGFHLNLVLGTWSG
jgi:hypothetical protein